MKTTNSITLAALFSTISTAAPVTFLRGAGVVNLRPDPNNRGNVFFEDTANNELIFIITNGSNAPMKITNIFDPTLRFLDGDRNDAVARNSLAVVDTNPCKTVILAPTDVCAYSIKFDTEDNVKAGDPDFGRWIIGTQVSVEYQTFKTDGVTPLPSVQLLNRNVTVTVIDPFASAPLDAEAVPEPTPFLTAMFGAGLVALGRFRKIGSRPPNSPTGTV